MFESKKDRSEFIAVFEALRNKAEKIVKARSRAEDSLFYPDSHMGISVTEVGVELYDVQDRPYDEGQEAVGETASWEELADVEGWIAEYDRRFGVLQAQKAEDRKKWERAQYEKLKKQFEKS